MKSEIGLEVWNHQVLMLLQALFGAISPNFRMVTLGHDGRQWKLRFVIEEDIAEDREEIEDIATEFEALQLSPIEYDVEVRVNQGSISWPHADRVIFRRRES